MNYDWDRMIHEQSEMNVLDELVTASEFGDVYWYALKK